MGIEASVDVDFSDVFRGMSQIRKQAQNLRPAFQILKPIMFKDQKQHHTRREGPDGKWPPNKESTQARTLQRRKKAAKKRGRKPPKRASRSQLGKLRTAFSVKTGRQIMVAETKVPWSGVHQDGGRVGRGAVIPPRVHRWQSDNFLATASAVISNHVFGVWERKARMR